MKKVLIGIFALVTLSVLAQFIGKYWGSKSAQDAVEQEAIAQRMPLAFFNVKWLASKEDLRSIRPNVVPDGDGFLAEPVIIDGRVAKIDYYVKTGNVLMYVIHFSGAASQDGFNAENQLISHEFGPLTSPQIESDRYGQKYCSHRKSGRFQIDHCLRPEGQTYLESLVYFRTKPQQSRVE